MSIHRYALALGLAIGWPALAMAEEAKKIRDNSFLVEEAYNQEAGVVQHIQSFMYLRQSKEWAYSFTQDWPLGDETHQLSYTAPVVGVGDPERTTGVGDIALNCRYQAIAKDGIAFAPAFRSSRRPGITRNGTAPAPPSFRSIYR